MIVDAFTYYRLDILSTDLDKIPVDYGIYKWVYWPAFDPTTITSKKLIILLEKFTKTDFQFEEDLTGVYKFKAKIWEQGYKDNGNIFGLSDSKALELKGFLSDSKNFQFFNDFFKIICFARPFYLGKGNNLNSRIKNHIAGRTEVLKEIIKQGIPQEDIWVGYQITPAPINGRLNNIFEEIYTRRLKPGLTLKPN